VREQDFAVFYGYRTPCGALGRFKAMSREIPIKIGKAVIRLGGIVFGDIDGVVITPRNITCKALTCARRLGRTKRKKLDIIRDDCYRCCQARWILLVNLGIAFALLDS